MVYPVEMQELHAKLQVGKQVGMARRCAVQSVIVQYSPRVVRSLLMRTALPLHQTLWILPMTRMR